jgi:hypothetical protein
VVRLVLVFVVSALYFSVGGYHIWKMKEKAGELQPALIAYGAIWMVLGLTYFWAGIGQVFYELEYLQADKTSFYLNCTFAFAVIIPYYYFASYLLWGDHVLSSRLMALAVAFFVAGVGMTWSTPVEAQEVFWGRTWDFISLRVGIFFQVVGALPILVSLFAFMLFLYPQSDSKPARYRLFMTTLSFTLLVAAWFFLASRNSVNEITSIVLSLASGLTAHLAFFPPHFIRRRIGRA